jgi:Mn-dependent DtxR family transcriptional regulator
MHVHGIWLTCRFLKPTRIMAIAFGTEAGLWTAMARNGDVPQKVSDLAEQLGVEEELLHRMMRHTAACGCIEMVAPGVYKPTKFSKSLALELMSSGYLAL